MTNNQTQRDIFWNEIFQQAKNNRDIIIVTADMGAPALDQFRRDLPGQFVNVGIAEQNGLLVALGLALSGKRPFFYAIAPFATLRCLEQIRIGNGIMNLPITIVGVGTGFGYEDSGPTHHLIEDIAIIRSIPNIRIDSVTDTVMAEAMAKQSISLPITNYVRLDRLFYPNIYEANHDFLPGIAQHGIGEDIAIVSTGTIIHTALSVAQMLQRKYSIDCRVLDAFRFPLPNDSFLEMISPVKVVVTLEEHFLPGGLGGAVAELCMDQNLQKPLKRIGLTHDKEYCYAYGGRKYIHEYYGIDKESVFEEVRSFYQESSCLTIKREKKNS